MFETKRAAARREQELLDRLKRAEAVIVAMARRIDVGVWQDTDADSGRGIGLIPPELAEMPTRIATDRDVKAVRQELGGVNGMLSLVTEHANYIDHEVTALASALGYAFEYVAESEKCIAVKTPKRKSGK